MATARTLLTAAALAGLVVSTQAAASGEADACIQTKTWSHYENGWSLRTATTATIKPGEFDAFSATLYGGRRYLIELCGEESVDQVDLVLYDREGNEVARAKANGREPVLEFAPEKTRSVFIVAHLRSAKAASGEVALAILHQ